LQDKKLQGGKAFTKAKPDYFKKEMKPPKIARQNIARGKAFAKAKPNCFKKEMKLPKIAGRKIARGKPSQK
jgi:DNA-directed RNA polymerase subunit K/omega